MFEIETIWIFGYKNDVYVNFVWLKPYGYTCNDIYYVFHSHSVYYNDWYLKNIRFLWFFRQIVILTFLAWKLKKAKK